MGLRKIQELWTDPVEKERMVQKQKETRERTKKEKEIKAVQEKVLKEIILQQMSESDWIDIARSLVNRAKKTDRSFEVLRDTIGQKPVERQEITQTEVTITVEDKPED